MTGKLYFILGVAFIAVCNANVARNPPQAPTTTDSEFSLTNLLADVEKGFEDVKKSVRTAFDAKDDNELKDKLIDQVKSIASQIDVLGKDIKEKTENFQEVESVKELRSSVDNYINDLKKQNPETARDVESLVDSAKKGTEQIVNKLKELSTSEDAKKLKSLSETLIETAVKTVADIGNTVHENLTKKD